MFFSKSIMERDSIVAAVGDDIISNNKHVASNNTNVNVHPNDHQSSKTCTKCNAKLAASESSSELCKTCKLHHKLMKCRFCRSEFFQDKSSSKKGDCTCKKCDQFLEECGEPRECTYCLLKAAFIGSKCQRCANSEKKYGPPLVCEQCKQKSAFDRTDPESKKKVEGKLLCWLCTISYKRSLARAKLKEQQLAELGETRRLNKEAKKTTASDSKTSNSDRGRANREDRHHHYSSQHRHSRHDKSHHHQHQHQHHHSHHSHNDSKTTSSSFMSENSKSEQHSNSAFHDHNSSKESSSHNSTNGTTSNRHSSSHSQSLSNQPSELNKKRKFDDFIAPAPVSASSSSSATLMTTATNSSSSLNSSTASLVPSFLDNKFADSSSDLALLVTQLKDQVTTLTKKLQFKDKELLSKDQQITQLQASNAREQKDLREKINNLQKEGDVRVNEMQSKLISMQKQYISLTRARKAPVVKEDILLL